MPDQSTTPPRVGIKDPEIIESYHRCIGMADALSVVNDLHINMPGIVLATEAIKGEIASERARLYAHCTRFVARAGHGNEYVAAGFKYDREAEELVVELKSLAEIDVEMEQARAARIAKNKGGSPK